MSSTVTVSGCRKSCFRIAYQPCKLVFVCYAQDLPSHQLAFALAQALDTNSLLLRDNALCIRDSYTLRQESHANGNAVGGDYAGRTMKGGTAARPVDFSR
jgi:hypothetical protein